MRRAGRPRGCALPAALLLKPVRRIIRPVRGHPRTDPQANAEWDGSPLSRITAADHLAGTDQGRGPLELLNGQQAQGVAHEDGHARASVKAANGALQPPDGEDESGQ